MDTQSNHYASYDPASRKWLLILLVILSMPVAAAFFTDHKERSEWEKRELAKLPKLATVETISQYFSDLDLFFNDHIGFALKLNKLYRQMVYYVFHDSPVSNISYGKNGFTYLNSHSSSTKNINTSFKTICNKGRNLKQIGKFERELDAIHSYFNQRGYPIYFGVPVTKVALYPENLPNSVPEKLVKACHKYVKNKNLLTLLDHRSTDSNIFHYPQKELLALKNQPNFYPKENFHWNGMSAHYFSRGLLSRIGITFEDNSYEKKHLTTVPSDLSQLGFKRNVKVWRYAYKDYQVKVTRKSPELIKNYYNNAREYSEFDTGNPATQETALVLSNSFGADTVPHLAPAFKKLYHINLNHMKENERAGIYGELIDKLKPDRIIFIYQDEAIINARTIKKIARFSRNHSKHTSNEH